MTLTPMLAVVVLAPFAGAGLAYVARVYQVGRLGVWLIALGCPLLAVAASFASGGAPWTAGLACLLFALGVIDADVYRLPDPLTLALAALGGAWLAAAAPSGLIVSHSAAAAAGLALFLGVNEAYRRFRGIDGLGRGDAKLMGALGLWVGPYGLLTVLMIAPALGLAFHLVAARLRGESADMQSMAPFGPFLAAGGFLAWLAGPLWVI